MSNIQKALWNPGKIISNYFQFTHKHIIERLKNKGKREILNESERSDALSPKKQQ